MSFKSDQLEIFGTRECREVGEREMIQRTALAKYRWRASVRGCLFCAAGIQATFICGGFTGSLDKQMQNEKELIRLASAGVGGLFCICVESINLT